MLNATNYYNYEPSASSYGSYSFCTASVPRKTDTVFEHGMATGESQRAYGFVEEISPMAVGVRGLLLVRVLYSSDSWAFVHDVDTFKAYGYRIRAKRNGYPY